LRRAGRKLPEELTFGGVVQRRLESLAVARDEPEQVFGLFAGHELADLIGGQEPVPDLLGQPEVALLVLRTRDVLRGLASHARANDVGVDAARLALRTLAHHGALGHRFVALFALAGFDVSRLGFAAGGELDLDLELVVELQEARGARPLESGERTDAAI